MESVSGERVHTRAELMAKYGLGRSTLEKWYRERAANGHPEAAGTVGRELVWDAAEWSAWYAGHVARDAPAPGLVTRDQLAERHGLSRHALKKLWAERENNGHPEPVRQVGKALYWDEDAWADWYSAHQAPGEADPDELITLAEVGRILGLAPSSVTVYVKRPPVGWPSAVAEEPLSGGRVRRLYRREDVLAYARSRR